VLLPALLISMVSFRKSQAEALVKN
jgi:hypothetical protein